MSRALENLIETWGAMALGRLRALEKMFATMDSIPTKALASEATARTLLAFLAGK